MTGLLLSVAAFAGVAAATAAKPTASPRHQLLTCMTREMAASKSISYNEASRLCKTQLKRQSVALASAIDGKSLRELAH
ncbi:MAG: hypothetical protein M3O06_08355 [Pseudomonadota bacterium]|nr:hypothetical protein [Pseudomonadota bacterium]